MQWNKPPLIHKNMDESPKSFTEKEKSDTKEQLFYSLNIYENVGQEKLIYSDKKQISKCLRSQVMQLTTKLHEKSFWT